jgi:hypothetical protein
MFVSRRSFLNTVPLAVLPAVWRQTPADGAATQPASAVSAIFPTQAPELAQEMVGVSHSNLPRVKELLARHPTLARACWDWGFGDWEDALGAASHVGRRDIAEVLIANGARPTIFSATMLGQLDVVKAFVAAAPGIESTPGPHGITLLSHAQAGGPQAQPVFDYLKTLPGANTRPGTQPITTDELNQLAGDYVYGAGPTERIAVAVNTNGILTMTRAGRSARNLFHLGDKTFYPTGAPLVRIRFMANALTVHDPDLIITARRG